jgi:hypothetical protein
LCSIQLKSFTKKTKLPSYQRPCQAGATLALLLVNLAKWTVAMSQQSDKISAIISVCDEIAKMAERLEGKQVNPVLLSATFDCLLQARGAD